MTQWGIATRLGRWLGPWTPETKVPEGVVRDEVDAPCAGEDRPMRVRFYSPAGRAPQGALLLVQGLHHLGADDPRLDRFAAILADSGILVCAPFLPDFARLRVAPGLMHDTARGFEVLERHPALPAGIRPGVFSISFGSLPALRLAADEAYVDRVGGLCLFGGYAQFPETIRFCLNGSPDHPHDPLNRPVVFLSLLDQLEDLPADVGPVTRAWERYVHGTWGKPELKEDGAWQPLAHEMAAELTDESHRELFLVGCGALPGGPERIDRALGRAGDSLSWLDPRPHLAPLRCPTWVVHGKEDDVIPWTEAALIADALPPAARGRVLLTGLYAHTGRPGVSHLLGLVPAAVRELGSMVGILRAFAQCATAPAR